MPFEEGHNKSKGRPEGAENKITKEARILFKETLEGQVSNIGEAFDEVFKKDKARYLEIFCKYAQYFVPKQLDLTTKGEEIKNNYDDFIKKINNA